MDIESIKQQMKMTLNESIIPSNRKGAFLTVYDGKNITSAVAIRINDHWELEGNVNVTPHNKIPGHYHPLVEGEVKIRATW